MREVVELFDVVAPRNRETFATLGHFNIDRLVVLPVREKRPDPLIYDVWFSDRQRVFLRRLGGRRPSGRYAASRVHRRPR